MEYGEAPQILKVPFEGSGLTPHEPIVINNQGGSQSALPYRMDLLPADTLLKIANVLNEGAEKYGEWNWTKIPTHDHINHALVHIFAYLNRDNQDDHLLHACCRLLFAEYMSRLET